MATETSQYDALIIGSGQGGNPLAAALARRGERVALIESDQLGGTCINTGCTPTKTMVASAQIAYYASNAARWGVSAKFMEMDMKTVLMRKNERVMAGRTGWEKSVDGPGQPRLLRGRARFTASKTVEVSGQTLDAKRIFIDTGSTPTVPSIEGLDRTPYLTNETLMRLDHVPTHLLVVGGGYVGLEFAQMFRRFGSEVTVIQGNSQILPREDAEVAEALKKILESEGIRFRLSAKTTAVSESVGEIRLTIDGAREPVTGSHLLVAVGRTPQTTDLDLAKTGVETDKRGYIVVNDRLETSAPDIWALGDVTGGPAFTHISYNDFQIIYGNLYEGKTSAPKRDLSLTQYLRILLLAEWA